MSKKRIPMPRRLLAGVAAFLIAVQPLQALAQDTSGAPTSRVLTGPDLDALVAAVDGGQASIPLPFTHLRPLINLSRQCGC